MFIRPVGVTVRAADRPAGRTLLRGLLLRATGAHPRPESGRALTPDEDPGAGAAGWRGHRTPQPEPEARPHPAPPVQHPEPEARPHPAPPLRHPEPERDTPTAPPEPAPPEPPPAQHLVTELTQLADLAREGLLTPEEFTTAKARLLGG